MQQVRDLYAHVKLNHADARHIICAWRIPGLSKYECEDSCDDDDVGAGAAVLRFMKNNNIMCRAILVVRRCGNRLYDERIPTYIKCAEETIKKNSYNTLAKTTDQVATNDHGQLTYAGAVKSPPKPSATVRGRGRGQGRGRGGRSRRRGGGRGTATGNLPVQENNVYIPKSIETHSQDEADDTKCDVD